MNNKRAWVLIAVAVIIVVAGLLYWQGRQSAVPAQVPVTASSSPANALTESVVGGTVPSFGSTTAPLANQPDVNPAANANPLQSIKTNPFQ